MKNTIGKAFNYNDIKNIYGVINRDGNTKKRTTIKGYRLNGDEREIIGITTSTARGTSQLLDCAYQLTRLAYVSSFTDGENGPTACYIANQLTYQILY